MKTYLYLAFFILLSCQEKNNNKQEKETKILQERDQETVEIVVLGNVQDAGSPHIACKKECCAALFDHPDKNRQVVSLGLIDRENNKKYLFEATPDISRQLKFLKNYSQPEGNELPDGIFLTHAHIGHYTGLMYLGKEATNANQIKVYAMPLMKTFLESNGPWSQLVTNNNIKLQSIDNGVASWLSPNLQVTPIIVPHRDEFSETVGYKIKGPNKTALFIPDIDKYSKWDKDIIEEIKNVDYAFLDATFYDGTEINNRDISEIPHPFVIESMKKFNELAPQEKSKIVFIHFNHTNPLLDQSSPESKTVIKNGYRVARMNDSFDL